MKRTLILCWLFLCALCWSDPVNAQTKPKVPDLDVDSTWITSLNRILELSQADSLLKGQLRKSTPQLHKPTLSSLKKIIIVPPASAIHSDLSKKKSLLQLRGGYLNYQWNYRSNIDTPFLEQNISQHLLTASIDFTVAETVPIRMTLFHRNSNSEMFRDFTDFRLEFDGYALQQWQTQNMKKYREQMLHSLEDPRSQAAAILSKQRLEVFNNILDNNTVRTQYLKAKELSMNPDLTNLLHPQNDSLQVWAKEMVKTYELLEQIKSHYSQTYDSLIQVVNNKKAEMSRLRKSLDQGNMSGQGLQQLKQVMKDKGYSEAEIRKLNNPLAGIRTLAIGRTLPQFSPLTVSNVNVKGVNLEYARNNKYAAFTAGVVDFRVRDFIYAGTNRVPQYLGAANIGLGTKEGKHLFLTVFGGQKQLYPTVTQSKAFPLYGAALELQYVLFTNHRFAAEIAQSKSNLFPAYSDSSIKRNVMDKNSRAIRLQLRSYIPATRTVLNAMYLHQGMNYQSFTSFRPNAEMDRWNITLEQKMFSKMISLTGSIQKNDFTNPYVLQRYNSNAVYKTAAVNFRKAKWPSLHLSYSPGSQMSVIDSMVYENRFQVLNMNTAYQYKIGTAHTTSIFALNKFYNDNRDTGFLYYNATNLFYSQDMVFNPLKLNWGFSYMENGVMNYTVMEAGVQYQVYKNSRIHGGIKINKLGVEKPKLGFYLNTRLNFSGVGDLNIWMEQNYLPGMNKVLVKNSFYNIGFTRYFTTNRLRR